jgi:methyl-accepting chemotaxis protein
MNIKSRIMIGFGLLIAISILISVVSGLALLTAGGMTDIISRANNNELMDERASIELVQAQMHSWAAVATHDSAQWRKSSQSYTATLETLAAMLPTTLNPQRKAQVQSLIDLATENEHASDALQTAEQSSTNLSAPEFREAIQRFKDTSVAVRALSDVLAKSYHGAAIDRKAEAATQRTWLMAVTVGLALGSLAVGSIVALAIARSINRPIAALTTSMAALANGDLSVEVPGAGGRDEVGAMARAVEVFKDNAIRARELEDRTVADRTKAEADRRRAETEAVAREQAVVINSFGAGLKQLTEGDLTHRVDQGLPAVYEPLRADFNAAMETLEQTMRSIAARASGIRGGTQEIASASNDLSRRTEQQAASLEQTAAALDGVTATVTKTSEGAGHAKKVVDSAKTDTQNSSKVVLETVEAMGAIERSANEVTHDARRSHQPHMGAALSA